MVSMKLPYLNSPPCSPPYNGLHEASLFKLPPPCAPPYNGLNVLGATTACSTSKSAPRWSVFRILRSKSALHHSRVQFLISHPIKWLRTRRFREPTYPTFRPYGASKLEKQSGWRLFYLSAPFDLLSTDSLFSDSFSSLTAFKTVAASVHKSEV